VLLTAGAAAGAWLIDDPRLKAVFLFSGVSDCHPGILTKILPRILPRILQVSWERLDI
jgi:hypothetical protein